MKGRRTEGAVEEKRFNQRKRTFEGGKNEEGIVNRWKSVQRERSEERIRKKY
jgi:hypothetical protein